MKISVKIFIGLLIFALFSCRKESGKTSWDVYVLTPIINASLSIDNILTDTLIQNNPDTSVKIVYNNQLYDFSPDSLLEFPDTISNESFKSPFTFPITISPGAQIANITKEKVMDFNDANVTKVIIKSGSINLKIQSTVQEDVICTYTLPYAESNGQIFSVIDTIPAANGSIPSSFSRQLDISGYTFDLRGLNGNSSNILISNTKAIVSPLGNDVTIYPTDSFQILVTFGSVSIEYGCGYFGSVQFQSGVQHSSFGLFKKITDGTINFENMHLELTVNNGYGVDARIKINEIKSINSNHNTTVTLSSPLVGSAINISRATETGNVSNPIIPTVTKINFDNSNFKQLIENLPDQMDFSIDVTTNPLGNVSGGKDFASLQYNFNVNLDLEFPLSIIAQNLTLKDTLNFSFSEPSQYEINNGTLTLIADNGFPFSASLQLFLLNENNIITDSLVTTNNIIDSAPVDANNKVISKKRSFIKVPVSQAKLSNMYEAKKIIIIAKFNTANQGNYIKIYRNYSLDMKLTGDFDMTINK